METNENRMQQTITESDYAKLASKHFRKAVPTESDIQLVKSHVREVATNLLQLEEKSEEEVLVEAFEFVEYGTTKRAERGSNSLLPAWTKDMLFEFSKNEKFEVSVAEAAEWLRETRDYLPKGNNAIGDVLGHGCHCLAARGSGKTKVYIVPDHRKFPDFYRYLGDVPPREYYADSNDWKKVYGHEAALPSAGKKTKSRFREQLLIQANRSTSGNEEHAEKSSDDQQ